MKESRKIIPFLIAACTAFVLFLSNPPAETHVAKIKAEYMQSNPRTWRVTWGRYERSLKPYDYLFFSVVKRNNRPISVGIAGFIITI